MKKYLYILLISLLTLITASCGGNNKKSRQFPTVKVTSYTVQKKQVPYYEEYPAKVVALNQVEIRPEVSGYITGIYFDDGQYVNKGDTLYAIDQQQYKAAYDVAKANLEKAKQDYKRYSDLAKNNAVATQILEHSFADLKAAQSNLEEVETNLRNSVIKAPFSGTIGISLVKMGSAVTIGQTLMNTISSDNPMAVDFSIDESLIPRFNELLHKKYNKNDSTFSIVLPDQSVYKHNGRLILLDRAVDPQTGTITARLVLPNPNFLLKPGMTCNVRVLNVSSAQSVIIPYKAVTVQMGENFVFAINNNKVSQKRIELGMPVGKMIIVKKGLSPGEVIVLEGIQNLHDGSSVKVVSRENLNNSKSESDNYSHQGKK